MKYRLLFPIFISLLFLITACGPSAEDKCRMELQIRENITNATIKHTFDAPFPKRNRILSRFLGDTIEVDGPCYPLTLQILSTRKSNMIINLTDNDTIFKGTVCKYRDLYYFNEKINNTCYRIFALRITEDSIYGFLNYLQYVEIDKAIEQGAHSKLVKYRNKNSIGLHPDKRELRRFYTSILAHTSPFAIIKKNKYELTTEVQEAMLTPIEADDFELIAKIYPNPATDILNVDLQKGVTNVPYFLSDLQGKILLQGQLQGSNNKIDVAALSFGLYNLTVGADQEAETIKIIKAR